MRAEPAADFAARGWLRFAAEPAVLAWVESVLGAARAAVRDPANAGWLRCGGTWFVGVDALPNDAQGRVDGGPPLAGAAIDFLRAALAGGDLPLHRAQVSVCLPGYPQPAQEESPAGYRFRREHDAAHVDGLLAEGPQKRRYLREPHAWILGLPLCSSRGGASPPVVWEGSHRILGAAFASAFAGHAPARWGEVELTAPYQQARREAFAACPRVLVEAQPGEAILMHRHLLHGMAAWAEGASAGEDGRMIAYFRPQFAQTGDWLARP